MIIMPRFSYREEPLDEGEEMSQEEWEMRKLDNNAAFFFLSERNLLMRVRRCPIRSGREGDAPT
jgi:hypothetical protein